MATPAQPTVTLDEIVVTGTPEASEGNIHQVSREEIERQGAHHAAQVLEREASINTTTGRRGERIFTFVGFEQRQVSILVDGIPAYIPYDGQVDLGSYPAAMIDHLTLVRGPASVLYGPGGLGGAVNIVTRLPGEGPLLSGEAEAGRGGALRLGAVHSLRLGPVAYTVFGGLRRRDAFPLASGFTAVPRENGYLRQNSDERRYHAGGNVLLRVGRRHELSVGARYLDGAHGVPPGLLEPTVRYWRFSTWRAVGVSLGHAATYRGGSIELDEKVYLNLFDNLLDSFDDASYSSQTSPRAFHTWYNDQIVGGRIRGRYRYLGLPWGPLHLRGWLGGQLDRHRREDRGLAPGPAITRGVLTFIPEAETLIGQRWSLLGAVQLDLEIPGWTPGVELSPRGGWGPLLSVGYDPIDELSLRATVARRARFATLRDRFSTSGSTRLPNPELRPEAAWHFGLEARWQAREWLLLQAGVSDAEVVDLIELAALGGGQEQVQNIGAARLFAAESTARFSWRRFVELSASYVFLHARRLDDLGDGDRLAYRPRHKAIFALAGTPWGWLELHAALRLIGPQDAPHPASGAWGELGTQAVLDAGLTLRPARWVDIWIRATNLLDADHQTHLGYPEPGREVWVGMRGVYDRSGREVRRR